ncbi:MAG: DUF1573 domain-containing protein [Muribaculaceae bacterium]|nr:DUF1573 domain-containing protein [Muribaculaceae bacterium]
MKGLLRSLLVCISAVSVYQTGMAEIEWLATNYDFGVMKEAEGPQTGSVLLVNHGPEPTYIDRVRPSCGCTGAAYTDEPIMPGDTAKISFTYNPLGRPGRFEKTVKVYMGEESDLTTIYIKGTVIGTPATLDTDYPVIVGPLRMSTDHIDFGKVRQGSGRHNYIKLYNTSDKPIVPQVSGGGLGIEIDLATSSIAPGEVGTFSIYLNTTEVPELGEINYDYTVRPWTEAEEAVMLKITADITPDLSRISGSDLDNVPAVRVIPGTVELGEISGNKDIRWQFEIADEGKRRLNVIRVTPGSTVMKVKRQPQSVKSGKRARVEGVLKTALLPAGPFRFYVEIVTDDPLHPVIKVPVAGVKK